VSVGGARRYLAGASVVAAASGAAAWALGRPASGGALAWGALGWGSMAAIGLAAGAWLAASYGRPGSGFLAAIVAGILSRIAATLLGAAAAATAGHGALGAFLVGLGCGFGPLQLFEVGYFYRAGRRAAAGRGSTERA